MKVKIKPHLLLFSLLPYLKDSAIAIDPYVYLPDYFYKSYLEKKLSIQQKAILFHEVAHLERQRQKGVWYWLIRYFFSPSFRYKEELHAIKKQAKYLKTQKKSLNIERYARDLSSWRYLKMVSREKALSDLDKIFAE